VLSLAIRGRKPAAGIFSTSRVPFFHWDFGHSSRRALVLYGNPVLLPLPERAAILRNYFCHWRPVRLIRQFPVGLSTWSITNTSIGCLFATSFTPSCSWTAVKMSGRSGSAFPAESGA